MNLDERIKDALRGFEPLEGIDSLVDDAQNDTFRFTNDIRQLIREVLEYVKPKRKDVDYDQKYPTQVKGAEQNDVIDEMEAKQKELGL